MYYGVDVDGVVFEDVVELHAVALGDVSQRFTSLDLVCAGGVGLGFGFDIDDLVFHRLAAVEHIVELAEVLGRDLHVGGDALVGVAVLGDDEIGVVVAKY